MVRAAKTGAVRFPPSRGPVPASSGQRALDEKLQGPRLGHGGCRDEPGM